MTERNIDLKNPWVAGLLAWLFPGAGHFYQRRHFKAGIYAVCIIGTLLYGMALGEWRPIHWTEIKDGQRVKNWSFLLQSGVGTPGIIAYTQTGRFASTNNRPTFINAIQLSRELNFPDDIDRDSVPSIALNETIDADFDGKLDGGEQHPSGTIVGRIHLEPQNQAYNGTLEGTLTTADGDQQDITLQLGNALFLDRRTLGAPRRQLAAKVVDENLNVRGSIVGTVPRNFSNWFAAPLDGAALTEIHLRLNKQYEMALVFTWIAGLLNILAVWDAVQGPAYGFGDEPPPEKTPKKKKGKSKESTPPPEKSGESSANGSEAKQESLKEDPAAAPVAQEK